MEFGCLLWVISEWKTLWVFLFQSWSLWFSHQSSKDVKKVFTYCKACDIFYWEGFNKFPFQLLTSYKGHEESKSKIGQERSSVQQADYHRHWPTPRMQESVSMHKSPKVPTPLRHSRIWIKQGRKKRIKRGRETRKTEDRRPKERKAAQ